MIGKDYAQNVMENDTEKLKTKARELGDEARYANPGRLSEINIELTTIKAFFSERLDNILIFKAERMEQLKTELATAIAAKIKWTSSTEGKEEIILRGIVSRIKDMISVIKFRINVKRDESYGQY